MKTIRRLGASFLLLGLLLLLAGCKEDQAKTNTVYVTNNVIVEKRVVVTNEVIVEKLVDIPLETRRQFDNAFLFVSNYVNAPWASEADVFKGIKEVNVQVGFGDQLTIKAPSAFQLQESELTTFIELELRKNGIQVNKNARHRLSLVFEGLWNKERNILSYSATSYLRVPATILMDDNSFKIKSVPVWIEAYNAYAGINKLNDGLKDAALNLVMAFSNAYLAANPK